MLISILLNSRNSGYENSGSITNFLSSLEDSLDNGDDVEVIFKLDDDDYTGIHELADALSATCVKCKSVITPRRFYKGLHIGYYECLQLVDKSTKIITCMADDFLFRKKSWDFDLKVITGHLTQDDLFMVQDFVPTSLDLLPIAPMWSKKIIELCDGFGPVFSTDAWSNSISLFLRSVMPNNLIIHDIGLERILCHLDHSDNIRFNTDRKNMRDFINSVEYSIHVKKNINNMMKYISSNS